MNLDDEKSEIVRMLRRPLLVDAVVLLAGLALVSTGGQLPQAGASRLLLALGTGLFAAGFVSALMRYLYFSRTPTPLAVLADRRLSIESEYRDAKRRPKTLDIVAIALVGALHDFSTDDLLLARVLDEEFRVRFLFLSPEAPYLDQRATEDGVSVDDLRLTLRSSVQQSKELATKLRKLYTGRHEAGVSLRTTMGSFEIRVVKYCPHFTVFVTDDLIRLGLYVWGQKGTESPVLGVRRESSELARQLLVHFERLWNVSAGDWLVRCAIDVAPTFNAPLCDRLMGTQGSAK
jgi:hypothetical protein